MSSNTRESEYSKSIKFSVVSRICLCGEAFLSFTVLVLIIAVRLKAISKKSVKLIPVMIVDFALFCFLVIPGVGCELSGSEGSSSKGGSESGDSGSKYTVLTVNKWTNGEIVKLKDDKVDEQWFKFVATTSTQRVYVKFSTLTEMYVYLYDANSNQLGDKLNTSGSASYVKYFEKSLTSGETYYIKVTGGYWNKSGTYKIGFNSIENEPQ